MPKIVYYSLDKIDSLNAPLILFMARGQMVNLIKSSIEKQ